MKDLVSFLVEKIVGSKDFEIAEKEEDGRLVIDIALPASVVGLVIGKEGRTIKMLRRIASIRAVLEGRSLSLNVTEKD